MAHEHRVVSAGLPPRAASLVQRAEAELVAAQFSSEPWERFSHAHLAALRAGAAVVTERGRPGGRRAPRTVWEMLDAVAAALAGLRGVKSTAKVSMRTELSSAVVSGPEPLVALAAQAAGDLAAAGKVVGDLGFEGSDDEELSVRAEVVTPAADPAC